MSVKAEIDQRYASLHAKLNALYYASRKIDAAAFAKLHAAIWLLHEKESIAKGVLSDSIAEEATGKLRSVQIAELISALGGEDSLKDLIKQVLA